MLRVDLAARSAGVAGAIGAEDPDLPPPSASQWFALRFLAASRLAVALLLLVPVGVGRLGEIFDSATDRAHFLWVAGAYLGLALLFLIATQFGERRFQLQLLVQGVVDVTALTAMAHFAGTLHAGIAVVLVAAVAGLAVLATPRLAGFFAALAALLLLVESSWRVLVNPSVELSTVLQSGLFGAACFVTAYVINWLASRLDREERLAGQRGDDLHSQLAITQLVIAELQQGVMVVSRRGTLLTMNRAASALLGGGVKVGMMLSDVVAGAMPSGMPSAMRPAAAGGQPPGQSVAAAGSGEASPGASAGPAAQLAQAVRRWQQASPPRLDTQELMLRSPIAGADDLRVRVRFLQARPERGDVVLVIENLRLVEERAQQLKLASMGRLSASIAHEIRNPLAAIRHANGLLAEQCGDGSAQRLVRIVETNTVRIDRIVEDVLSISRREPPSFEAIDLNRFLPDFVAEFQATAGGAEPADRIAVHLESPAPMWFDPNHLRQILVNVLGNASRYASRAPAAIRIEWRRCADDRLELGIADDGPGLAPELLQHLFEPFFTTEARGTGLGLYLARELCHANGAGIRSQRRPGDSRYPGEFVIEPRPRFTSVPTRPAAASVQPAAAVRPAARLQDQPQGS